MRSVDDRVRRALAGRYVVERELGRGGMATVYLAHDVRHERAIAIKVLHPGLVASVSAERFLREIRIAARLTHPNILPLHDSGEADGLLYYVMPYAEEETLRHRLRRGALTLTDAVRIARGLAEALRYAHARGVVHRDIKPENLLLTAGQAVVADFGIARALDRAGGTALTTAGLAIGTPAYMSPEQASGAPDVDGRSDIYSAGCVLFEMLAGVPPFRAPDVQTVVALQRSEPPPALRAFRATVPDVLDAVVRRALAKSPAERFGSAGELLAQLDRLAPADLTEQHEPIDSIEVRGTAPAPGPRRRRAPALTVAGVALFAAAGVPLVQRACDGRAAPPDEAWLVVAPFNVLAADSAERLWGEDAATRLSIELSDVGALRTVAPSTADAHWPTRADASSAAELARRTAARFVLYGTRSDVGGDSVRVEASLLDVGADSAAVVRDFQWEAPADHLTAMLDSLVSGVLTTLGERMPIAAVRGAWLGARTTEPALKEFLRGERAYRRSDWATAIGHYQRALDADSTFPLALRRIAAALSWQGTVSDAAVQRYRLRAGIHNHGLPPRESLLVAADSLAAAVQLATADTVRHPPSEYWRLVRRLFATLDAAVARDPRDAEAWYLLGDAQYHHGVGLVATPPRELLGSFDRAIALDSGFAPSYLHPVELGFLLGGDTLGLRYARRYLDLNRADISAAGIRLTVRLVTRDAGAGPPDGLLDDLPPDVRWAALKTLDHRLDADEAAVAVVRTLAGVRDGAGTARDCTPPHPGLARRLAYRGHLRDAWCRLGRGNRRTHELAAQIALLGGVPRDTAAALFAHWLDGGAALASAALPWWSARGDTLAIRRLLAHADSVARLPASPVRERAHHDTAAARAYLALARGDTAQARRRFATLPDTLCRDCWRVDRLVRARLLAAQGDATAAHALLTGWSGPNVSPLDVRIALERGRAAEQAGDAGDAARAYRMVVAAWRDADAALQPLVREARVALARLDAGPASAP